MPAQRSASQKAHSISNIRYILQKRTTKNGHKTTPTKIRNTLNSLSKELAKKTQNLDKVVSQLKNSTRQTDRAHTTCDKLRDELRRLKHTANVRKGRVQSQKDTAVKRALKDRNMEPNIAYLKVKGVITDGGREMVRELANARVPDGSVNKVIHIVGKWLGIDVKDAITERSVGRIIQEGGVAAQIQLIQEVQQANGFGISGDGTTIRHINYKSKHITLQVPEYGKEASNGTTWKTRFFGITSGKNHTSETQLESWVELRDLYYDTYNRAFKSKGKSADPVTFAAEILALNTDHSEDQMKFCRLVKEWKALCDKILRGREALKSLSLAEVVAALWEESANKVAQAGGLEAWDLLSDAEKDKHNQEAYERVCRRLGEEAWNALPQEVQTDAALFIWAGCCMHKEGNSTLGGAKRMSEFWSKNRLTGPLKLYNRDNEAAVLAGSSTAQKRAEDVSEAGAIKLTKLAGMAFNHKDDKKGLQDTYRHYFESRLGYAVRFPDTSNTRFQSHLEAALALLVHLPYYIDFLLEVKDNKEKENFNHLEANVYKALNDVPTITELATLTLYLIAISHPYMKVVRATGEDRLSAHELGPLHEKVKAHCQKIIDDPNLLISPEASHTTGALDGEVWVRADAFYVVQKIAPTLPHLRGCVISFFEGALETWERFTREFAEGGAIAALTDDQKKRIFINPTNDVNEGEVGNARVRFRNAPNLTLRRQNAARLYRRNETKEYIENELSPGRRKFLRSEVRRRDGNKEEETRRQKIAVYNRQKAEAKRQKRAEKVAKKQEAERVLDNLDLALDVNWLRMGSNNSGKRLTVSELKLQIEWHRRLDMKCKIPIKTCINKMKHDDLLIQLLTAVQRFHDTPFPTYIFDTEGNLIRESDTGRLEGESDDEDKGMGWEEREEIEDNEMCL